MEHSMEQLVSSPFLIQNANTYNNQSEIENFFEPQEKLLVVEDDESVRSLFLKKLESYGFNTIGAKGYHEALSLINKHNFKAILLDQNLGDGYGLELIPKIIENSPYSKIVFLTAHESVELVTKAMSRGASGFLLKSDALGDNINKFLEIVKVPQNSSHAEPFKNLGIVGRSSSISQLIDKIQRLKGTNTTVLLSGESGVGKELFAKAIHQQSDRKSGPFIAINCAAISENLLEAELFGAKKGAFTDARADRKGYFETCSEGTLLLDEIGEMSLPMQSKLLRVLQEKEVTPLGSCQPIKVNTRVIAATNKNLREEVANKNFREDLFYRLAVIDLEIPPLRDRIEDIPLLVEYFLKKLNKSFNKSVKPPKVDVYARLKAYSWPGNIRELYNAIERAVLLADSESMVIEDLLPHRALNEGEIISGGREFPLDYSEAKSAFEKVYIKRLLEATNYCITDASKVSNQYRTNIYRLIKKHNIETRPRA